MNQDTKEPSERTDDNVVAFPEPEDARSLLDRIVQQGAQRMLQAGEEKGTGVNSLSIPLPIAYHPLSQSILLQLLKVNKCLAKSAPMKPAPSIIR
ncbi:hypothetical protein Enr8_40020 [Blastopirellula retiformator]|uniref:Uncharacterized protein n=1 Tax=Blastopirellula retiformator TaxID=2527970 RepID=A0A5C5V0J0_9BACT|nr:hypothetical protein Enr8_40020 [Blastopirellula retiformator]